MTATDPVLVRRRIVRRRILFCVLVLLLLKPGLILWRQGGRLFPNRVVRYQVSGPSMEPAFPGPRLLFDCPQCKREFQLAFSWSRRAVPRPAELDPDRRVVSCPHCGFTQIPFTQAVIQPGQQVAITPFRSDRDPLPVRWTPVLFRDEQGRPTLKRLVGLPGETITLSAGDLLVQGKRVARSLAQLKEMAVPLATELRRQDNRILVTAVRPVPCSGEAKEDAKGPKQVPCPVTNESPYPVVGEDYSPFLELVHDFSIGITLTPHWLQTGRSLEIQVVPEKTPLSILLNPNTDQVTLRLGDQEEQTCPLGEIPDGVQNIGLFYCDRTIRLTMEEREIAAFSLPDPPAATNETPNETTNESDPTALANEVGNATLFILVMEEDGEEGNGEDGNDAEGNDAGDGIESVEVCRDVHYDTRGRTAGPFVLPPGHVLLLGDNSIVSEDARSWSDPTLPTDRIEGIVSGKYSNLP